MLKENNAVDCDLRKVGFQYVTEKQMGEVRLQLSNEHVPPIFLYWVSHFNQESPTLSMQEFSDLQNCTFSSFLSSDCYYFRSTPTSDHHQLLRVVLYTFDLCSSCCHCGKLCVCVCQKKQITPQTQSFEVKLSQSRQSKDFPDIPRKIII